jgi:hypothetical protein
MKTLDNFSSTEILGISIPEKLFSVSTEDELKRAYRKLSALWHPDKHISTGKDTNATFAHIQVLYERDLSRIKNGEWNKANLLKITDKHSAKFEIRYLVKNTFEFGLSYVGKSVVAWEFSKSDIDFAEKTIKSIQRLNFADTKMKEEFKKYLPEIIKVIDTPTSNILIFKKDSEAISLRDVLNYHKGFVDPKHVAWILSGMYNLACFNQYNGIMQAGFSLDNYFINPSNHLGQLIGGWWFTHKQEEKLTALSSEAVNIAPVKMINNKKADMKLDLELIKLVGRQLLGDTAGVKLHSDKRIPKELANWLTDSLNRDAFTTYNIWQKEVLPKSFGVRRFIKMNLTINDIYN